MKFSRDDLTQDELKRHLHYNPETGHFTWIKPTGRRSPRHKRAGGNMVIGYRCIGFRGLSYLEHRLAFLYMLGRWPKEQVDHINCKRDDNRWENLRECTQTENNFASPTRKDNTCGHRGVSYDKARDKWFSEVSYEGQRYRKRFDTMELAAAWADKKRRELAGDFCS